MQCAFQPHAHSDCPRGVRAVEAPVANPARLQDSDSRHGLAVVGARTAHEDPAHAAVVLVPRPLGLSSKEKEHEGEHSGNRTRPLRTTDRTTDPKVTRKRQRWSRRVPRHRKGCVTLLRSWRCFLKRNQQQDGPQDSWDSTPGKQEVSTRKLLLNTVQGVRAAGRSMYHKTRRALHTASYYIHRYNMMLLTSDLEVDAHEKSALQSWHTSDSEKGTQSGMNSPLASAARTAAISSSASK